MTKVLKKVTKKERAVTFTPTTRKATRHSRSQACELE